jgi:CheY-like chemotaxis protein
MTNVLIVEDDGETRAVMESVLRRSGYEVRSACEGGEALQKLSQQPADVVVTDMYMPGMDGFETIRNVRKDHPGTKVVAMTAWMTRGDSHPLVHAFGADRVLTKPFQFMALLTAIREVTAPAESGLDT